MNKYGYLALFAGVLLLFIVTAPANHGDAEDSYYYARMMAEGEWGELFHSHHLFYLPAARFAYRALSLAGFSCSPLSFLIFASMFSGAFSVCLLFSIFYAANNSGRSWVFAVLLLVSYGFWRYSTAAEIYIPATALSLGAVYCALRSNEKRRFFGIATILAILAVLLHLGCVPAVFLAVPLIYLLRREYSRAATHILLVLSANALLYGAVSFGPGLMNFHDAGVYRGDLKQPLTWLKGIMAWGQDVFSGNFLFAYSAVAERLTALFPGHMLQEEIFMGAHAPSWVKWFAPLSLATSISLFFVLVIFLFRVSLQRLGRPELFWAALLWLAGSAAMAMCFEPANPEIWIFTLPPLWLVLGMAWHCTSGRNQWLPVMLAGALFLHNFAGGLLLIKDKEGDYCYQKAKWIIQHVTDKDVVLCADSHSFTTFLQYHCPARVMDMKFQAWEKWNSLDYDPTSRIFVYGEVIDMLPAVAHRASFSVNSLQKLGDTLRPYLHRVHEDEIGVIYQWEAQ